MVAETSVPRKHARAVVCHGRSFLHAVMLHCRKVPNTAQEKMSLCPKTEVGRRSPLWTWHAAAKTYVTDAAAKIWGNRAKSSWEGPCLVHLMLQPGQCKANPDGSESREQTAISFLEVGGPTQGSFAWSRVANARLPTAILTIIRCG